MTSSAEVGEPSEANDNAGAASADVANGSNDEGPTSASKLLEEIMYCFASFQAVVTPVSITMILAALATVHINTDETRAAGEAEFSRTYEAFDLAEGDRRQNFLASLANTLIMVSVICVMTFVVVILYKYGCVKIFYGYILFVFTMLFGYFSASMGMVAIEKWGWRIDKFSFAYIVWNYGIVGVVAILKPLGIPRWVTQGYLISCSVILARQFSSFNAWTAWTLLVVLAFYDLFAVLTPCGPLKALANLMSRPGAQAIPGLLYEAQLPTEVNRPNRPRRNVSESEPTTTPAEEDDDPSEQHHGQQLCVTPSENDAPEPQISTSDVQHSKSRSTDGIEVSTSGVRDSLPDPPTPVVVSSDSQSTVPDTNSVILSSEERRGEVPLALAKMYKLTIIDSDGRLKRDQVSYETPRVYQAAEIRSTDWTPQQLCCKVTTVFPARGGYIEESNEVSSDGPRYNVYGRAGNLLRRFIVDQSGSILEVVQRERTEEEKREANTIKLGLGDFIFYSLLVSKAALHSFTSFAACMLVILMGLGGTLVLLAVNGKALPALPISIFLGVIVFFWTMHIMEPFIEMTFRGPLYV